MDFVLGFFELIFKRRFFFVKIVELNDISVELLVIILLIGG